MNPVETKLESDKVYWHQYMDDYERLVFTKIEPTQNILEFGVFQGASIAYLLDRFKHDSTHIYGVDIFGVFDTIKDDRFTYLHQDQGKRLEVKEMFKKLNIKFDLIIDDGSHQPDHQALCLIEAFPYIRKGGFYIVEDIHASFVRHGSPTIFQVLLMIKHLKSIGSRPNRDIQHALDYYFTEKEIIELFYAIDDLHMIRRSHLPLRCWKCGGTQFDYHHLQCLCGEELYKENDSMSFVIQKKR